MEPLYDLKDTRLKQGLNLGSLDQQASIYPTELPRLTSMPSLLSVLALKLPLYHIKIVCS